MGYLTVKGEASSEFEERKSVFIGHVKRVQTEEEAKEFVNKIKSLHREARHNVYAYVIGENKGIQRYSDDGEPQGTGGIPVLEVIKKSGLTDTVVVVTRYFGGILLGAGGLVRAYSKGASQGIKEAGIVEKVKGCSMNIVLSYDLMGKVQYVCEQNNWYIEKVDYSDKVSMNLYCEMDKVDRIKNEIVEITSGNCSFSVSDEQYYFKQGDRLFSQ
ncbi:MAG: YigZ family protein [Bacillota bacterium]|nr:YigZ family protein [Bacillota bacterium]